MESTKFFRSVLKETPFFSDMKEDHIVAIAGCASSMQFPAKDKIYSEGSHADRFLIIQEGHVAIDIESVHRGTLTVHTVGPGQVLGWSWLFPPYRWHYNARAVQHTRAIALDANCIREKAEGDPALGYELMKRFSAVMMSRLEATRMQLMDIYDVSPPSAE